MYVIFLKDIFIISLYFFIIYIYIRIYLHQSLRDFFDATFLFTRLKEARDEGGGRDERGPRDGGARFSSNRK